MAVSVIDPTDGESINLSQLATKIKKKTSRMSIFNEEIQESMARDDAASGKSVPKKSEGSRLRVGVDARGAASDMRHYGF